MTDGSSSGIACRGSSLSFVVFHADRSSSLFVMGVFLPSASCSRPTRTFLVVVVGDKADSAEA